MGNLLFLVVDKVSGCDNVWMLLISFVLACEVFVMIWGELVLREIIVLIFFVKVLIIGKIWFSFFCFDIGVAFGCVDFLFILIMDVFLVIILIVCVIVEFLELNRFLFEKELGVILSIFMMWGCWRLRLCRLYWSWFDIDMYWLMFNVC